MTSSTTVWAGRDLLDQRVSRAASGEEDDDHRRQPDDHDDACAAPAAGACGRRGRPSTPPTTEPAPMSATTRQSTSATKTKIGAGDAVDGGGEHVLDRVAALQRLGDADAEHAHQQHALGGAEVAAVDAGEQHGGPHPPGALGLLDARAPRRDGVTHAESRGWTTTRTHPEHDQHRHDRASNAPSGSTSSSTAPDRAAEDRGAQQPQHPAPLAGRARRGSRSRRRPTRAPARCCWRRWRSPAARRRRGASGR